MSKEIGALTGIRGAAACYVVLYHVHEFDPIPAPFATFLRHGYVAVDLFFVLSGFVIALSYKTLFEFGFTCRNYFVFLLRRVARVYPLYLVLTLLILARWVVHTGYGVGQHLYDIVLNLTLLQAWGLGPPIDGPSWSVSTEVAAYLFFPALAAATIYRELRTAVVTALCSVALVCALTTLATPSTYHYPRQGPLDISWEYTPWPLVRCICEFALGLVAFRFSQQRELRSSWDHRWFGFSVAAALTLCLLLPGTDILTVSLFPVLLLTLVGCRTVIVRFFECPTMLLLGRLSYSIYLLHYPLLGIRKLVTRHLSAHLAPALTEVLAAVAFHTVLFVAACACFKAIEEPGRRLIRRLERTLFPVEHSLLVRSEAESVAFTSACD